MDIIAVDTSVAVPLLVSTHDAHAEVVRVVKRRRLTLPSHALAETYSVLTRLPGDARVAPTDAVRLLDASFGEIITPKPKSMARLHVLCAELAIAGGAVYDALVALAARDHQAELLTRDRRAGATYQQLGIAYSVIGA